VQVGAVTDSLLHNRKLSLAASDVAPQNMITWLPPPSACAIIISIIELLPL